jgi:hypothetical protein
MKLKRIKCPCCNQSAVEVKLLRLGFWLVKCCNGECDELPEVMSKTRNFAINLFMLRIDR